MQVQVQEQKLKRKVKLSQILKNATEEQCFGQFMKISEITDLDDENHLTKSKTKSIKICVNGLLMSKSGIGDEYVDIILFQLLLSFNIQILGLVIIS